MRIAWFTPLSARSAIGEFSCHVVAALSEFAEVEVWTSDVPPYHPTEAQVLTYGPGAEHLTLLPSRDVVIYNMGDYLPFHGDMHAVAQEHPGVVILHDRVLHHLYAGLWLTGSETSRDTYVERMRTYYGKAGGEAARSSLEGKRLPVWECDEEALAYPLYEEAIRGAIGVITHSQAQADQIAGSWLGPVRALHLPCYRGVLEETAGLPKLDTEERVQFLTLGHLNPNKQVDRVIEMIGADHELAARVHYTVVGPDEGFAGYVEELRGLIVRNPHVSVELLGWRSEAELHRLMEQADVFVNLRHPVMEGGSASLMRQLAYGRAIVCFESGFFHEVPEGSVRRVAPGDFDAVATVLRELASNSELRRELGERARSVAAAYDERSYAEGLLALVEEACAAAPALKLLDTVSRELGRMGVGTRLPIFDDIATDFSRILAI